MSSKVAKKVLSTTTPIECERTHCRLRVVGGGDAQECLMDAVRDKWSDPGARNYCEDPACKRFVDLIHTRPEETNDPS